MSRKFPDGLKARRKIVQIATMPSSDALLPHWVYALCDDGTIWYTNPHSEQSPQQWYYLSTTTPCCEDPDEGDE